MSKNRMSRKWFNLESLHRLIRSQSRTLAVFLDRQFSFRLALCGSDRKPTVQWSKTQIPLRLIDLHPFLIIKLQY